MKKVITLLLALVLVLGLVGCSGAPAKETTTPEPTVEPTVEPTPTEAPSSWKVDYTQDEFGDDTDNSFIFGKFSGKFSNTATSGSDLTVYVYYIKGSIGDNYFLFRLAEYGNHVATYTKSDLANLSIKINDEVYGVEISGIAPNGDLMLSNHDSYQDDTLKSINGIDMEEVYNLFLNALRDKQTISCSITIGDISNITSGVGGSNYKFKIDGNGFAEQESIAMNGAE